MIARRPLEEIEWQAVGDVVAPEHHLHASTGCGGCNLHGDAIDVLTDPNGRQEAIDDAGSHWIEGLAQLTGEFL